MRNAAHHTHGRRCFYNCLHACSGGSTYTSALPRHRRRKEQGSGACGRCGSRAPPFQNQGRPQTGQLEHLLPIAQTFKPPKCVLADQNAAAHTRPLAITLRYAQPRAGRADTSRLHRKYRISLAGRAFRGYYRGAWEMTKNQVVYARFSVICILGGVGMGRGARVERAEALDANWMVVQGNRSYVEPEYTSTTT